MSNKWFETMPSSTPQLLSHPLLNCWWFSRLSNRSLSFSSSPCWSHWNTWEPWLLNVADHMPPVAKLQKKEVNWVWISVLHASKCAPCVQGCVGSSVCFQSIPGLWHLSVDVTDALQWAAAQGYVFNISRVHIQFFLWWSCKMSGFQLQVLLLII